MSSALQPDDLNGPPLIRVRGRSFLALVLAPVPPVAHWLAGLDAQLAKSATFFDGRPVVVDLTGVPVASTDVPGLIAALQKRDIRIIGVEGADDAWPGDHVWGRPPMAMTRVDRHIDVPDDEKPPPPTLISPSLVVNEPVRSGQRIMFEQGDVTVLGAVGSGAEIIAGGSIHVYGALRGRAIAGLATHGQARIFCRKNEAELMAIDGVYRIADDMPVSLRKRAVQSWLEGDVLMMAGMD